MKAAIIAGVIILAAAAVFILFTLGVIQDAINQVHAWEEYFKLSPEDRKGKRDNEKF